MKLAEHPPASRPYYTPPRPALRWLALMVLGMIAYAERHSPRVWAALALMFAGPALVKPKR